MNIGSEMPFRRSQFARKSGSLLLDRERDDTVRRQREDDSMHVWKQGHFRKV